MKLGDWGQLHRLILYEKKRNLWAAVLVYRSIVESILLYGSETWVLQGYKVLDRLEKFHRRCARFLSGDFIRPGKDGTWVHPHTENVFKKAGLELIEKYTRSIEKRKVHVANYLTPDSSAMTDITNLTNVDINMEKISWW